MNIATRRTQITYTTLAMASIVGVIKFWENEVATSYWYKHRILYKG